MMFREKTYKYLNIVPIRVKSLLAVVFICLECAFNIFSQNPVLPDSIPLGTEPVAGKTEVVVDRVLFNGDDTEFMPVDTVPVLDASFDPDSVSLFSGEEWVRRPMTFNPDPTRAVWLAALFPGLGQVYNRRYWKLPIIVGGYLGLGYATNWNNTMLRDYTRAYADLTDRDPSTKSYMDFFPATTKEENIDKKWLENTLRTRKNFYRRNRDLCVIGMVGVYLLAVVDAYVDASLAHFDISPDLTATLAPTLLPDSRGQLPAVGVNWAFVF